MKYCVLYNRKSGGKTCGKQHKKDPSKVLINILKNDELYYRSMPEIKDFKAFFNEVKDDIIICGGDGTLSYFLNKIHNLKYKNHLWFFPTGSGNDFCSDIEKDPKKPFPIDEYLKKLATLKVDNKEYVVFNGAGAGIDGYTCAEGERLRKKGKKTINYTLIGLKGLLYDFKPHELDLEIDEKSHHFKNVWFSPIMLGRYFGGGMMVAPMQDRIKNNSLSIIVVSSKNRPRLISIFPKIFKGQHIKYQKIVKVFHGNHIKVTLSHSAPFQYDGEVIENVSSYEMHL